MPEFKPACGQRLPDLTHDHAVLSGMTSSIQKAPPVKRGVNRGANTPWISSRPAAVES
jgi:hypothetical protein